MKKIKIVPLRGECVEEIEEKATQAVNEGGKILDQGVVLVDDQPIPALIIIRDVPDEGKVFDTELWRCPACRQNSLIRFDPDTLGVAPPTLRVIVFEHRGKLLMSVQHGLRITVSEVSRKAEAHAIAVAFSLCLYERINAVGGVFTPIEAANKVQDEFSAGYGGMFRICTEQEEEEDPLWRTRKEVDDTPQDPAA